MPIYTYQEINEDGTDGEMFDIVRAMSDPPLTEHPETGKPVKRVYKPVHIAGVMNELHSKNRLSDKNLDRLGFTKYQRNGKGHYERTAGKEGPDLLSLD